MSIIYAQNCAYKQAYQRRSLMHSTCVRYVRLRICPHLGVRVCNIFIKARYNLKKKKNKCKDMKIATYVVGTKCVGFRYLV